MTNKYIYSFIFFIIIGLFSCKKESKEDTPMNAAVNVAVQQVKKNDAVYYDSYPGNIISTNEVQLRSQVTGYLTAIHFQEGGKVYKGQKLYEIDRTKYAAAYSQAAANLEVAKSNFYKAQKDAERFEELGKKDAVAKQRVDYAQTDFLNAKQQVAAAQAQAENTRADLARSVITAPFDGTIGISQVKLGAYIVSGQTLLNTISSDDPLSVDFVISENEIPRFNELLKNKSLFKDSVFTIAFGTRKYPYPGKIEIFDRAVDPQTGTLKIRLSFPNPERELKSGMSCQVRVLNRSGKEAVLIPNHAVVEQMGEFFVYVVKKDTARQQKITLGENVGRNIIIKEGLSEGETIVISGIQKLREGTPVKTDSNAIPKSQSFKAASK